MSRPKGIHATFQTECVYCRGDITVTNGRAEFHECPVVVTVSNVTSLESIKFPGTWK